MSVRCLALAVASPGLPSCLLLALADTHTNFSELNLFSFLVIVLVLVVFCPLQLATASPARSVRSHLFPDHPYGGSFRSHPKPNEANIFTLRSLSLLPRPRSVHSSHSYNLQTTAASLVVTKGTPSVYVDDKADSGKMIHRYALPNSSLLPSLLVALIIPYLCFGSQILLWQVRFCIVLYPRFHARSSLRQSESILSVYCADCFCKLHTDPVAPDNRLDLFRMPSRSSPWLRSTSRVPFLTLLCRFLSSFLSLSLSLSFSCALPITRTQSLTLLYIFHLLY